MFVTVYEIDIKDVGVWQVVDAIGLCSFRFIVG
jgi:hypothetical protein